MFCVNDNKSEIYHQVGRCLRGGTKSGLENCKLLCRLPFRMRKGYRYRLLVGVGSLRLRMLMEVLKVLFKLLVKCIRNFLNIITFVLSIEVNWKFVNINASSPTLRGLIKIHKPDSSSWQNAAGYKLVRFVINALQ